MSARKVSPITPALPPVEVAMVKEQPWAANLGGRATKILAAAGIVTEEQFLGFKTSWDLSFSASREIERRQYELRIERGLLDPAEPMTPEKVQETLRHGGVLFEGDWPFVSLGSYRAPEGKYYRLEGGDIYLEEITPRHASGRELKGYHTVYHSPSSKTDKTYGIMRRVGFEDRQFDVELTRRVYGMEFDALEELVVAYGRALRHDITPYQWERVTCSNKANKCNLTGNLIPADFPYITMEENMYWGAHISIAAFYNQIKLLTGHADARHTATKLMTEKGVAAQTWTLLKGTGNHFCREHVKMDEVCELLYR